MPPVDLRNAENIGETRYPYNCASYSPYTAQGIEIG